MFLNETLHPKAEGLYKHLCLCAVRDESDNPDWYAPLVNYRQAQGWSDEKAADLYARIEEGFTGFNNAGSSNLVTQLSEFLWANDKAVRA